MGPQPLISDKAASVGVSRTFPLAELEKYVSKAKAGGRKVHFLPPYRYQNMIRLNQMLGVPFDRMRSDASEEFIKAVVSMRLVKEQCEIEEIDKACNIGYAMHFTAMKMARPGMVEQQLVGVMEGIAIAEGLMPSFPIILSQHGETLHNHNHDGILTDGRLIVIDAGAEQHGETLHNHNHDGILTDGRLIVIDAGAESNTNYCSDFTRTLPSSGKFTTKQKEIYDIVSAANNLALSIARPGITYTEVHQTVSRLMAQGLINLGILKGDPDEIVAAGAHMEDLGENYVGYDDTYKRSTQFGLGSLRMGKMLEPGHVVTDEPGIYFIPALIEKWKKEGINTQYVNFSLLEKEYYDFGGIRLEDNLLITEKGCRLLGSKRLPITTEDVEREMSAE